MKIFTNNIYPISLVLSFDYDKVDECYYPALGGRDEHLVTNTTSEAQTICLSDRRTDAMAVGIVFNTQDPTFRLIGHEAFHAVYFMMDRLHIPLSDYSDEAWAYLMGWVMHCVMNFAEDEQEILKALT